MSAPFVPPNIIIPEQWDEANTILSDYLIRMGETVNSREIATYQQSSLDSGSNIAVIPNGQKWFVDGDATQFDDGLRSVIDFGALPNTTSKSVAHGISVDSNTVFTKIAATASNPGSSYIPIPYVDTAGNSIEIEVDGTNVIITTPSDYTAYTQCYVILEWVQRS